MKHDAFIIDALRSPTGRRNGSLAHVHGADLGAHVIRAIVERNDIPPAEYDDVIFGCVDTIGPLAGDIARTAWLVAGMPLNVPGTTVDRQCGSSQQAVHFAAQAVMSGTQDVVVAGGVQNMSTIPIGASTWAMRRGLPGRTVASPKCIETVVARLSDGAVWKYTRYFDSKQYWSDPGKSGGARGHRQRWGPGSGCGEHG